MLEGDAGPDFAVVVAFGDDETLVEIGGELDVVTAPVLREVLLEADGRQFVQRTDAGHRRLVIDLSAMTFVDAAGLGVLAVAAARAAQLDRHLALRPPSPWVCKLLEITCLLDVFDIARFDGADARETEPLQVA